MSIAAAFRSGVLAIKGILDQGGLLVDVQREAFAGQDLNGRDKYAAVETIANVLFEDTDARVVQSEGVETVVKAKITILAPLVVSVKDRWILPDGRKMVSKIVRPGVVPTDGLRITTEVLLG